MPRLYITCVEGLLVTPPALVEQDCPVEVENPLVPLQSGITTLAMLVEQDLPVVVEKPVVLLSQPKMTETIKIGVGVITGIGCPPELEGAGTFVINPPLP